MQRPRDRRGILVQMQAQAEVSDDADARVVRRSRRKEVETVIADTPAEVRGVQGWYISTADGFRKIGTRWDNSMFSIRQ